MKKRTDNMGRAYAGSQLQIQTYVNYRQTELDSAIKAALPELEHAKLEWVSPLAEERFAEYQDAAFLDAVGHPGMAVSLAAFWPTGGPCWDALARVLLPDQKTHGVLLVEAKSYPREMYSRGCLASIASRQRIEQSLSRASAWFGARSDSHWTGSLYQFANRLAHLYFFRELGGVPAWLVNLCFVGDPHQPTTHHVWEAAMLEAQSTLGLGKRSIPYVADVYCEAVGRDSVAQHVLAHSSVDAQIHEPAIGKREWRYCPDESGRDVFFAFANRGTSCSMRRFAARDGVFLEPASTRKGTFQTEFRDERTAGQLVNGPEAVSIVAIPAKLLCSMRAQAGLPDAAHIEGAVQMPRSLLSGFDALIDRRLGVEHIGKSEPHYPQTKAHRYVSDLDCIDGIALVSDGYQLIEGNWPGCRCRSKENWRWEKRLHISDENDSAEKRFEKAVTAACAEWMNMIPVASGVMPDAEEGGRRIDLARCFAPGCYEFVELKLGRRTDTPLRAAVEILGYGLIYVFSRVHANALGYDNTRDLLAADRISLKATLPRTAYVHGSLANLEAGLNEGLANLTDRLRLPCSVDFAFEALPEGASEQRPRESMERRYRMYSSV